MSSCLAHLLKQSSVLTNFAHSLRRVRTIKSIQELDAFYLEHNRRHSVVDDSALLDLSRVCFHLKNPRMPDDPFSKEYRERVLEIYKELSGRPEYSFNFESAAFDPEKEKFDFFPYNSRSLKLVGGELITQGFNLESISLPKGGSIVELGAGMGNTALHLALTGYQVTVVEVNQPSLDLMKYRASMHGRELAYVRQDMAEFVRTTKEKFDAVLFVASFHHCLEHLELLENLDRLIKPGGSIYFANEPIYYSENRFLPYPWGLRLDGGSLFFVRRDGWLELGFQARYLEQALARFGWILRRKPSRVRGYADFFEARRR